MKNLLIFLVLIFSVVGCGLKKEKKITKYNVHPELQAYVSTFQAKMTLAGQNSRINDLEAHFSDTMGTSNLGRIIGTCQRQKRTRDTGLVIETIETPIIKINRQWWENEASDANREELMYHELAHCILKRDHDQTIIAGRARSIMYPTHLGEVLYIPYYQDYMAELFNIQTVAFQGMTFNDEYASVLVVENSEYEERHDDDSHIKNCVHDEEPVHIVDIQENDKDNN